MSQAEDLIKQATKSEIKLHYDKHAELFVLTDHQGDDLARGATLTELFHNYRKSEHKHEFGKEMRKKFRK